MPYGRPSDEAPNYDKLQQLIEDELCPEHQPQRPLSVVIGKKKYAPERKALIPC